MGKVICWNCKFRDTWTWRDGMGHTCFHCAHPDPAVRSWGTTPESRDRDGVGGWDTVRTWYQSCKYGVMVDKVKTEAVK